jgi:hypothetical protein
MTARWSRRTWLRSLGVAGAGVFVPLAKVAAELAAPLTLPLAARPRYTAGAIIDLVSTSDVFIPPRGDSWMKFSFDFPEPAVAFGGHRFSFLLFTAENTYGLHLPSMRAEGTDDALVLTCDRLVSAGGQREAPGQVRVEFTRAGSTVEWKIAAQMELPIKSVTTVIRDVPRGKVSLGGGAPSDHGDADVVGGYPFCAGDLHGDEVPGSMSTPVAAVQAGDSDFWWIDTLDDRVRPKRYYFQAGERAYRVEAVYEHDAWRDDTRLAVPAWRIGRAASLDAALDAHFAHLEEAFALVPWASRTDVPPWMRDTALVVTLHGMHYTGFIFNDYAQQLAILRWIAARIPPARVLVFLPAWDGRYYWDYPNYTVPARMGGEAGFRALITEARALGFKMMPMFGTNAANRKQPVWSTVSAGATYKLDGNAYDISWVDWNNDRHQDGWLSYMNLGADAWRTHLEGRIAEMIDRYHVDAYFLDIVGGHVNSTNGDMHEGTRRLVKNLREKYPTVVPVGEMPYDALHGFIPMYQAGFSPRWLKYSRYYQHLSSPAPGRGSSGVHESGFSKFDAASLSLSANRIPTLQVVDDTLSKHKAEMEGIIAIAKSRARIA